MLMFFYCLTCLGVVFNGLVQTFIRGNKGRISTFHFFAQF